MKRFCIVFLCVLFSSVSIFAQDMKYRELKKLYDYRDYDPTVVQYHSPVWSGVASLFIPGLGQMVCGSVGRGFAYLGGCAGCYVLMYGGFMSGWLAHEKVLAGVLMTAGCIGSLTLEICAIVDAVRLAKVKNMYENDRRRKHRLDMQLYPSVGCFQTSDGIHATPGMTLAFKF